MKVSHTFSKFIVGEPLLEVRKHSLFNFPGPILSTGTHTCGRSTHLCIIRVDS